MPQSNSEKKPRGVVGALSKKVDALQGDVADLRNQMSAAKELVGATLRDGSSTEYLGFSEYIGNALMAFIQSAGYGAVGRDSVQNTMEALVDVYKGYLAFCGAPQSKLDDADARRTAGTERLNVMWQRHRENIAAKGGYGDGQPAIGSREEFESRGQDRSPEAVHKQVLAEDPSTWGVDSEAEAFLGPAN